MKIADVLLEDFDMEMAMTRRILAAIPDDRPDFKPHEKSMAFGRLAAHVANLPQFGTSILTTPSMDGLTAKWPNLAFTSTAQLLADFDANATEARAALAHSSDEDLQQLWKFSFGERVLSSNTRSCTFRHMFFNHMIHHRAQLGVYLRLNNLPVPGIYGPSADEPFKP
jgi:uncharacterized damage-inducible protein DinB